jgi:hypothetical protein
VKKEQTKRHPTAEARSPIRRQQRPPYARRRTPPRREPSINFPPRFERSPPPSVGFNGLRQGRQSENRTVPPVATLLESADTRNALPPPSTANRTSAQARRMELLARERELRESIDELHTAASRLQNQQRNVDAEVDLPHEWQNWSARQRAEWLMVHPEFEVDVESDPPRIIRFNRDINLRSTLPTPPHDESPDQDSLFVPDTTSDRRRLHPLSNSWRPDSPINGLGDRNRSPTPGDGWEVMRTTIAPDARLPSAESSFTSAAVARSFQTETDASSSSANSRHTSQQGARSESVSSIDPDDLVCTEEDRAREAEFAASLYQQEMQSTEGLRRVNMVLDMYREEGTRRFADIDESEPVEIGFRLMHEAFESEDGRQRLERLALQMNEYSNERDLAHLAQRTISRRWDTERRTRGAHIDDDGPPSPHPDRYSTNTRAAVREASAQVHDYFSRVTADSLTGGASSQDRATSPPPRYEPLARTDVDTVISRDPPVAHPVSPPSARSERDVSEALLSGTESDLEPMRRIVERLAARDDVPEEWWMSMGLNLSRTRARSRSPARRHDQLDDVAAATMAAGDRVRSGRIERGNWRL